MKTVASIFVLSVILLGGRAITAEENTEVVTAEDCYRGTLDEQYCDRGDARPHRYVARGLHGIRRQAVQVLWHGTHADDGVWLFARWHGDAGRHTAQPHCDWHVG